VYTASPTPFEIDVNILQLYAYAKEDWQKQSFGNLTAEYIRNFIKAVEKYTNAGKDVEAQRCFAKAISKHRVTIAAHNKVNYSGFDIVDGTLRILFHPEKFATNTYYIDTNGALDQTVDSGEYRSD